MFVMRAAFAVLAFVNIKWETAPYTEQKFPNGIARFVDLTWLGHHPPGDLTQYGVMACLVLYVIGLFPALGLLPTLNRLPFLAAELAFDALVLLMRVLLFLLKPLLVLFVPSFVYGPPHYTEMKDQNFGCIFACANALALAYLPSTGYSALSILPPVWIAPLLLHVVAAAWTEGKLFGIFKFSEPDEEYVRKSNMVLFFASIPLLSWLSLSTSFVGDAILAPFALFAALRAPTAQAAAWAWQGTSAAAAAAGAAAVAGSSLPPLPAASGALASTAMTSAEAAAAALADRSAAVLALPLLLRAATLALVFALRLALLAARSAVWLCAALAAWYALELAAARQQAWIGSLLLLSRSKGEPLGLSARRRPRRDRPYYSATQDCVCCGENVAYVPNRPLPPAPLHGKFSDPIARRELFLLCANGHEACYDCAVRTVRGLVENVRDRAKFEPENASACPYCVAQVASDASAAEAADAAAEEAAQRLEALREQLRSIDDAGNAATSSTSSMIIDTTGPDQPSFQPLSSPV
jgi:hypothetical protein